MPFKSTDQARACYAKRRRGQAKGWDCDEWSEHTNFKKFPRKVKKGAAEPSFIMKLAQAAASATLRKYQT